MDAGLWYGLGALYVIGGIISILLATAFDVEGAEAVPWFIFWPIFDLIAVGILAVRALRRMFSK